MGSLRSTENFEQMPNKPLDPGAFVSRPSDKRVCVEIYTVYSETGIYICFDKFIIRTNFGKCIKGYHDC
jgi:hypothetical protein